MLFLRSGFRIVCIIQSPDAMFPLVRLSMAFKFLVIWTCNCRTHVFCCGTRQRISVIRAFRICFLQFFLSCIGGSSSCALMLLDLWYARKVCKAVSYEFESEASWRGFGCGISSSQCVVPSPQVCRLFPVFLSWPVRPHIWWRLMWKYAVVVSEAGRLLR